MALAIINRASGKSKPCVTAPGKSSASATTISPAARGGDMVAEHKPMILQRARAASYRGCASERITFRRSPLFVSVLPPSYGPRTGLTRRHSKGPPRWNLPSTRK
jgi:hypothetical protein